MTHCALKSLLKILLLNADGHRCFLASFAQRFLKMMCLPPDLSMLIPQMNYPLSVGRYLPFREMKGHFLWTTRNLTCKLLLCGLMSYLTNPQFVLPNQSLLNQNLLMRRRQTKNLTLYWMT
jgi:hypothetical protein